MPRLFRKPEPIPKPTGSLPVGTDHAEWVQPIAPIVLGLRRVDPWIFVHARDPMVAKAPHLFRRCSDNQPVGPEPRKSAHNNSL